MPVRSFLVSLVFLVCALPAAQPVQAQSSDEPETARIHMGAVGLTPSVTISDVGIDSNVFNTATNPQKDFTLTFRPELRALVGRSRTRASMTGGFDVLYFQTYVSQRSLNGHIAGRFEFRANRMTPWVSGSLEKGRQRVGNEIDARVNRTSDGESAGLSVRVAPKTYVELSGRRATTSYDDNATFTFVNLRSALNETASAVALQYRQSLTVLTMFVVEGEAQRDEFEIATERNARSVRVQGGFDLGTHALVTGSGRIGYRKFINDAARADYSGLVAAFSVSTMLKGRTRLEFVGDRDIVYSYDPRYPYYVSTGGTFTVTPRLNQKMDMQARIGGARLAYQPFAFLSSLLDDRLDTVGSIGAGVGYHLRRDMRIGLNIDRQRRDSPFAGHSYQRYRVGTSVTYGR